MIQNINNNKTHYLKNSLFLFLFNFLLLSSSPDQNPICLFSKSKNVVKAFKISYPIVIILLTSVSGAIPMIH